MKSRTRLNLALIIGLELTSLSALPVHCSTKAFPNPFHLCLLLVFSILLREKRFFLFADYLPVLTFTAFFHAYFCSPICCQVIMSQACFTSLYVPDPCITRPDTKVIHRVYLLVQSTPGKLVTANPASATRPREPHIGLKLGGAQPWGSVGRIQGRV